MSTDIQITQFILCNIRPFTSVGSRYHVPFLAIQIVGSSFVNADSSSGRQIYAMKTYALAVQNLPLSTQDMELYHTVDNE